MRENMNLNKYKINRLDNDELKPEETLADVLSIHSAVESPIGRRVFSVFYLFVLGAFSLVAMKAFQLQIVDGKDYAVSAEQGSTSSFQLTPLRGIIYDSNNQPMVENAAIFDVVAVHRYLPAVKTEIDKVVEALAGLADINRDGLAKLFEENSNAASFAIKRNVSKEEAIKIENLSLPGVYVVANSQRHHIGGAATAHLLGYTAHVAPGDIEFDDYYFINDRIGRLGIEAQYEYELRGQHRAIDFGSGEITKFEEVTPGKDKFLNIDFTMQKKLYETLAFVFASSGVKRGAAIIQNPKTGAVLAIASMPAFDPNVFENSSLPENAARISNLLVSPDRPLLNRVISGKYSPGSTIKPLLALAGLKEGVVTPNTIINATGSITIPSIYDPSVVYTFNDWKVHGLTDLKKAIAWSVDVYFYMLGGGYGQFKGLGAEKETGYFKAMLADKLTGIDLPGEIAGFVPTPDWKKQTKNEPWFIGDTYNISIGQGDLGVTPLWINSYISSIANRGKIMKPYIVNKITDFAGEVSQEIQPQVLADIPFEQETIRIVREGMRQTITNGTASLLNSLPVPVAAKTGTAQVVGLHNLNSLFTVFGPYEDPTINLTILVEHIQGGQGVAIGVANTFLKWYFTRVSVGSVR